MGEQPFCTPFCATQALRFEPFAERDILWLFGVRLRILERLNAKYSDDTNIFTMRHVDAAVDERDVGSLPERSKCRHSTGPADSMKSRRLNPFLDESFLKYVAIS